MTAVPQHVVCFWFFRLHAGCRPGMQKKARLRARRLLRWRRVQYLRLHLRRHRRPWWRRQRQGPRMTVTSRAQRIQAVHRVRQQPARKMHMVKISLMGMGKELERVEKVERVERVDVPTAPSAGGQSQTMLPGRSSIDTTVRHACNGSATYAVAFPGATLDAGQSTPRIAAVIGSGTSRRFLSGSMRLRQQVLKRAATVRN